ncbi:MAG: hypothetical protein K0S38_881 [Candidatus Paceibacter sp.]|jgi:hypothetical protein|nr:hypothetical protein [Candidatus Paceibacter sp.]
MIVVIGTGGLLVNQKTSMATVINNPSQADSSTGTGVVIGILAVILLAVLFLFFGLPYLRDRGTAQPSGPSASLNVELPTGGDTGGNAGGAQ